MARQPEQLDEKLIDFIGRQGIIDYWQQKNRFSIDGLDTGVMNNDQESPEPGPVVVYWLSTTGLNDTVIRML